MQYQKARRVDQRRTRECYSTRNKPKNIKIKFYELDKSAATKRGEAIISTRIARVIQMLEESVDFRNLIPRVFSRKVALRSLLLPITRVASDKRTSKTNITK